MEPQININCRKKETTRCCIDLILGVLILLLSFTVGLIIGALTGLLAFLGIGAVVVLLVLLVILIIIRIIMLACKENRKCC